jgi:hypothetical protein
LAKKSTYSHFKSGASLSLTHIKEREKYQKEGEVKHIEVLKKIWDKAKGRLNFRQRK